MDQLIVEGRLVQRPMRCGVPDAKRKVAIGVVVRNCEDYLRDAIESVAEQDYPHSLMEIVFVDDGSEDDTFSIVRDSVSTIDILAKVFHTSWKGLGNARNMVLANANADFVLWVDGDMVLSKNFVSKLVNFMNRNPEVAIAKGKQALEPGGNALATLEAFARAGSRMVNYKSEKARCKSLGTGGAIYRMKTVKELGGFDNRLRGYGEDQDVEIRVRDAGWSITTVDASFLDYERHELSWKGLWRRYWLRGYYTHYFDHKNKGVIKHYYMLPPVAFFSGLLQSFKLYLLTFQKVVFLLPFQYAFKMTAWYLGFARGHVSSYEPVDESRSAHKLR